MKSQLEKRRLFKQAETLLLRTIKILDEAYAAHLKAVSKNKKAA